MSVRIKESGLNGVLIIESGMHGDERGLFRELYHEGKYKDAGLREDFVQDNHSSSHKGVLRGLHYQLESPQGKLITALTGEIFDVAVDLRKGSPDFGKWVGVTLSSENGRQVYIPPGFAHGFCVLSGPADVVYKCTELYSPGDEYGVLWSDDDLNIDWPVTEPVLSGKDSGFPKLRDIKEENLPVYKRSG